MKKSPKSKAPIDMLRDINDRVQTLAHGIQDFLDRYDEPTLIPRIVETAKKAKLKTISASWIQRRFRVGYTRAMELKDQMEKLDLLELDFSRDGKNRKALK